MGLKKVFKKVGKALKKVALPAAALFMTGGLGGSVLPYVFGKSAVAGMGGIGGKVAGGLQGLGAGGLSALMSLLGGGQQQQQQQQAPQMPRMDDPMAMQPVMAPSLRRWKGQ